LNAGPRTVPRLYLITDRAATGGRALGAVVRAALAAVTRGDVPAGALAVQLREKDLEGGPLAALAHELRDLTAAAGVALYVNDRVDVALAVGADGVHLGAGGLAPADVARISPGLSVAVSAHAPSEIEAAARAPNVRFAVFGPIFDTPSKRAFGAPPGLAALRDAVGVGLPLVAIGGISAARAAACLDAGAVGVAFIRAAMSAPDPARAIVELWAQSSRPHNPEHRGT
jgi:thiamine-phosphate pyrophosphorylase